MASGSEVPYNRFDDTKVNIEKDVSPPAAPGSVKNPDAITADEMTKLKDFRNKYNHANFLRKVYTVVFLQLLNVGSFILLFLWNDAVNGWVISHRYIVLIFGVAALFAYWSHSCCRHFEWNVLNCVCFFLYTVTEGLFIGSLMTFYNVDVILVSTGTTILLGLLLTIYAFKTNTDYTSYSNYLIAIFILLMVVGTAAVILRDLCPILLFMTAIIGVVLFSLYVVHSTQKVSESYDVSASVIIFVSVINLYIFITASFQLFLLM